jgi:hypothetical protein
MAPMTFSRPRPSQPNRPRLEMGPFGMPRENEP